MSEDCYSAEFIAVTDIKMMARLRGSKYLQAKVQNINNTSYGLLFAFDCKNYERNTNT